MPSPILYRIASKLTCSRRVHPDLLRRYCSIGNSFRLTTYQVLVNPNKLKQFNISLKEVTKAVETAMEEIKSSLPEDVKVTVTFRQETFIEASIKNVEEALRDGTIIVSVILILFLMNWRTAIISLSAIPLSILMGLIVLNWTGQGINIMTLGGLAVAIGSVVDDAIVDMENVYRRLRENQLAGNPYVDFIVVVV